MVSLSAPDSGWNRSSVADDASVYLLMQSWTTSRYDFSRFLLSARLIIVII